MNRKSFYRLASISHKPLWLQVLRRPSISLRFFVFTRTALFFKKPIKWNASTFWGKRLTGFLPDPSFSSIYLYKFSDEALTVMMMKFLKPGMVFMDVGAHIGYETTLASKIVGSRGRIFSFEPTPSTYELLYRNTAEIKNVVISNLAVWSKSGILRFFDYGPSYAGLNSFFAPRVSEALLPSLKAREINVCAISLDDYCTLYKVKPSFVKIDAESAEYNVLVGMAKTLRKVKPIVILEIGDMPKESGKTMKCLNFMKRLGYSVFEYRDGEVVKHPIKNSYLRVFDNLLFLPKL